MFRSCNYKVNICTKPSNNTTYILILRLLIYRKIFVNEYDIKQFIQGRLVSLSDDNSLHYWEINDTAIDEVQSYLLEGKWVLKSFLFFKLS